MDFGDRNVYSVDSYQYMIQNFGGGGARVVEEDRL